MQTIDGAYGSHTSSKTHKRGQKERDQASQNQLTLTTPTSQITAVPRSQIANEMTG